MFHCFSALDAGQPSSVTVDAGIYRPKPRTFKTYWNIEFNDTTIKEPEQATSIQQPYLDNETLIPGTQQSGVKVVGNS